jgi:hypothetical protein
LFVGSRINDRKRSGGGRILPVNTLSPAKEVEEKGAKRKWAA